MVLLAVIYKLIKGVVKYKISVSKVCERYISALLLITLAFGKEL